MSVLVPASGSPTDEPVFATALMLARPLCAHLDFYHVRSSPTEAAVRTPHLDFCMGPALPQALASVRQNEEALAASAAAHFKSFCQEQEIVLRDVPARLGYCTASWHEGRDHPLDRLMMQARHSDLVVLGRPYHVDYMPRMLLDDLLLGCGRPIVIAPEKLKRTALDTIVVGWKETPEAARALSAAMPLLEKARKVILLHVAEEGARGSSVEHLARQLKWQGITAEPHLVAGAARHVSGELARAAADLEADLLVVGAFGHARLREIIFGGVTQSLLEHADVATFLLY